LRSNSGQDQARFESNTGEESMIDDMSGKPASLTAPPMAWLADLNGRIDTAQQRATLAVNCELVLLYWHIGSDILAR